MKNFIEEIKSALGKKDESSPVPPRQSDKIESITEGLRKKMSGDFTDQFATPSPFSEKLFAPVEKLKTEIEDRDRIIENLKGEASSLKSKISKVEKEKRTIVEDFEKSKWLESKVALASKRAYEERAKSFIDENINSKLISILVNVARKKQGNKLLNWTDWVTIPENKYLFQVNENIARQVFESTNALVNSKILLQEGSGGKSNQNKYSLSFTGNTDAGTRTYDYVQTDFNPDTYNLNLGCTVSYWVKPDEIGNAMFALGRKHDGDERFVFGINRQRQGYFSIGQNQLKKSWVNLDTPVEEELLEESGAYWNLRTDMWYHFVVTYDDREDTSSGADRKLYVNGVLRQTDFINWDATGGGTGGIYFGARNLTDSYNNGWACKLDEVSIFNTSKDATWVSNAYNSGEPTDLVEEPGLVGYWRFNEGSGNIVKDSSGNGNHGTFGAISGNTTAYPTWSTNIPK